MRDADKGFVCALRGPVLMITIGVLFLLDKINFLSFGRTWPVLLIVFGALALAGGRRYVQPTSGLPPDGRPAMPFNPPPPPGVRR